MIFASGTGSNFQVIHENIKANKINNAMVEGLISNNPRCGAVEYARKNSIPQYIINFSRYTDNELLNNKLLSILSSHKVDLIVLAGYMKLIHPKVVNKYHNRIINIHPSLLPEYGGKGFYGIKVHQAVIRDRRQKTGVTVHYVNSEYDQGDIICQRTIRVKSNDTPKSLSERVLKYEHEIFSKVIKDLCN